MTTFYLPISHNHLTGRGELGRYPFKQRAYDRRGIDILIKRSNGTFKETQKGDIMSLVFRPAEDGSIRGPFTYTFKVVEIPDIDPPQR